VAQLSDALLPLIETYRALKNDVDSVIEALSQFCDPIHSYYAIREMNEGELNMTECAARFIYLNAHCFNGLYRTNRHGRFNVPKGSRAGRCPPAEHLRAVSLNLRNANLLHLDLTDALLGCQSGDFVYIDPPFPSERATFGEYGYHGFDLRRWRSLLLTEVGELHERGAVFALSMPLQLVELLPQTALASSLNVISRVTRYQAGGNGTRRRDVTEVVLTNSPTWASAGWKLLV
jgi:DNA adenine methylase